jgi:transcriptional regulator with XRE-family HTH domain
MARPRRPSAVYDEAYQALIRRVREAREEAGLTQGEVAERLGRPLSFVSKCELGERRIDPIDLKRFAELFRKPLEYFYETPKVRRKSARAKARSRS